MLKREAFYKIEFKKVFHRQTLKLNKFKGNLNRTSQKSEPRNWTYCMGQNSAYLKRAVRILEKKHDPGWNWFITVKCDYLFGSRNPVWDEATGTLIGNLKRNTTF